MQIPLTLDFRDGDKKNMRLDNLQLLCYNCAFIISGRIGRFELKHFEKEMKQLNVDIEDDDVFEDIYNKFNPNS